jgi:hypothetical protein
VTVKIGGRIGALERAVADLQARAVAPNAVPPTPLALASTVEFEPDDWQAEVLGCGEDFILNVCRQAGKSTVSGLLALGTALPGGLALVLSPTERQGGELLRKAKAFLRALPEPVAVVADSTTALEVRGGGRIVALPGHDEANIRGFSSVDLLLVDEAARVSDELYAAARPMLAVSRGRTGLLSTPFGRRGFFYREWDEGGQRWRRFLVPATECPRISPEFLAEERRTMSDLFYRSEYGCEFVDTVEQVFDSTMVDAAVTRRVRPLFAQEAA